jgi:hypothetical protein
MKIGTGDRGLSPKNGDRYHALYFKLLLLNIADLL